MLKGIFLLRADAYQKIYGPDELTAINQLVDIYAPPQTSKSVRENPSILNEVEVIFSGWDMAVMDEEFLAAAPRLKAVFYGAGSIRYFVTKASWQRGIIVTSAYAANAIPTAEYTLSQILLCLKRGWPHAQLVREQGGFPPRLPVPGAYGSTVGLISLGRVGRYVLKLLQNFDINVIAYDPFVTAAEAAELKVELCTLAEIFRRADVVSLHTPWLPETEGMITGEHLASMKSGAAFINTARGAIVREQEMIQVLQQRPDLTAVLDVTYPEPPEPGSSLYTLPNVVLTPHIAGAMDQECRRMGQVMVEELRRYLKDEPLQWALTKEQMARMA
ncbi:MAG: hydroxyacid dehydrogenase [Anaerolineae bacterium]|nr:hydroxyacid dehydrogenase [Anaerolineae bacterium]